MSKVIAEFLGRLLLAVADLPAVDNHIVLKGSAVDAEEAKGEITEVHVWLTNPRKLDHLECEFSRRQERRTVMKGTRHSEEQIIAILKQGEAGLQGKSVPQSCEQAHILLQTASMKGSKAAELPLTSLLLQVGRVG